jgi:uncharacterized phage-like protein YoqJ
MKIAVVGSRNFRYKKFVIDTIITTFYLNAPFIRHEFISGGAVGVDSWAEDCIIKGTIKHIFKPDWDKYGKRAGFLRNELIINEAERVIAFWDGESKGTKHSIDLAIKAGKPIDIYVRK